MEESNFKVYHCHSQAMHLVLLAYDKHWLAQYQDNVIEWDIRQWSSQTCEVKTDACRFLTRPSALLGQGKDWLAQCQFHLTEWDIKSCCW